VQPGVSLGAEARFLRKYDELDVTAFAGDALFKANGHAAGVPGTLDVVNVSRNQALFRLEFKFEPSWETREGGPPRRWGGADNAASTARCRKASSVPNLPRRTSSTDWPLATAGLTFSFCRDLDCGQLNQKLAGTQFSTEIAHEFQIGPRTSTGVQSLKRSGPAMEAMIPSSRRLTYGTLRP
jgi:hypothetical protein